MAFPNSFVTTTAREEGSKKARMSRATTTFMKENKGEQRLGSDDGLSNASPWSWTKGAGTGSTPNLAPVFDDPQV
jgi:hypothetical protein